MKLLIINSVCGYGSTGKICASILQDYLANGNQAMIAYGRIATVPEWLLPYSYRIGTNMDVYIHGVTTRVFDRHGLGSVHATIKFLEWAEEYDPDELWLHNIHGYYINYELLFKWIKNRPEMIVKWTLHDCWAFTGHCSHFVTVDCSKWQSACNHCPQKKTAYPQSYIFDNSCNNFNRKKAAFTGVPNLSIIVPSNWLKELVEKSFLNQYTIKIMHNKVDTTIFHKRKTTFKIDNNINSKLMILAVSNVWNQSKGFNDILKLASMIDSTKMCIVIVGVSHDQLLRLPPEIIGIERTDNQEQLAEIYSAADVFFNPTYQDTFPTVNLEAEACELPVITYSTGGAPETITNSKSKSIAVGDVRMALRIINGMVVENNE